MHNTVSASNGFTLDMNRFNTEPGTREHKPNLHTITVSGRRVETRFREKRHSHYTREGKGARFRFLQYSVFESFEDNAA